MQSLTSDDFKKHFWIMTFGHSLGLERSSKLIGQKVVIFWTKKKCLKLGVKLWNLLKGSKIWRCPRICDEAYFYHDIIKKDTQVTNSFILRTKLVFFLSNPVCRNFCFLFHDIGENFSKVFPWIFFSKVREIVLIAVKNFFSNFPNSTIKHRACIVIDSLDCLWT